MNEQRIQELKDALMAVFQLIEQSGEPMTPELESMLVQVMEHVATRIQQLRQEEQQGQAVLQQPTPEQIEPGMPSSNVEGFAFDPKTNRLLVRFLGKYPNRNGPIYAYDGVPPVIFDLFRKGAIPARTNGKNRWGKWWKGKVPSLGAALYSLIKSQGYNYQRLS